MPEISRFYGIVIKMYFADHAPAHFHAEYAEHEMRVAIESLAVISGRLPPRAMGWSSSGRHCTSRNSWSCGGKRRGSNRYIELTRCRRAKRPQILRAR
jgi:hypothetical protein